MSFYAYNYGAGPHLKSNPHIPDLPLYPLKCDLRTNHRMDEGVLNEQNFKTCKTKYEKDRIVPKPVTYWSRQQDQSLTDKWRVKKPDLFFDSMAHMNHSKNAGLSRSQSCGSLPQSSTIARVCGGASTYSDLLQKLP